MNRDELREAKVEVVDVTGKHGAITFSVSCTLISAGRAFGLSALGGRPARRQ
jgi:hypothetical protein